LCNLCSGPIAQERGEQAQPDVRDGPLGHLFSGVPVRNVRDLVGDDPGQLRLVLRGVDQTTMHPYRPAGQGKRVDLTVVRNVETVGIPRAVSTCDDTPPNARDITGDQAVAKSRHILTHLLLGFATKGDFIADRNQLKSASRAGCRQRQRKRKDDRLHHD
jgi:hypothetical protein